MTEKAKRKGNPRHRLLVRVLLLITVIVAVIATGIYLLQPEGDQIVFIAADDAGISQLWLVDLNHPENPRQLTRYEDEYIIADSMRTGANQTIVYQIWRSGFPTTTSLWQLNTQSGESRLLKECVDDRACKNVIIRSDAEWIAYEEYSRPGSIDGFYHLSIVVENVTTGERRIIYEAGIWRGDNFPRSVLAWIEETGSLAYLAFPDSEADNQEIQLRYYDVEEDSTVEQTDWYEISTGTYFSPDGTRFVIESNRMAHAANVIFSYEIPPADNSSRFPIGIAYESGRPQAMYFLGWYQDNETILIDNRWTSYQDEENPVMYNELSIYNTATGDMEALRRNSEGLQYIEADLNEDETRIIVRKYNPDTHEYQMVVYDIETDEEIILSVYGLYPQWVNGGR